jgi:Fe(3+) dicitrate transport protein
MPIALFALILAFLPAGATGQIVGSVTSASGEALPGANVFVEGTTIGSATDARGHFQIAALEPGDYVVRASIVGFETDRQRVTVAPGQTASVDFVLQPRTGNLAEVVVTARESLTGGPAGVRDLPGSAHYIGPRELRAHTDGDVMRVLREIPGVNVQEEEGYGLRPNIGLRGVGTERTSKITVMEDGILIAPAPYAAPAAYYFPTLGRMHGLEVRKGASQIKYGPYTTAGALNLITTPIPTEFSGYAEGFIGDNEARNAHVHVGNSFRNVGFLLETYQTNVAGFKDIFPLPDLETGFDKQDYMAKIRVNTNPTARIYQALELKLSRNDEVSRETYLGLTADDFARTPFRRYAGSQADRMEAAQRLATLRHVAVFSDRFDLTTTVYRTSFARNWYKLQTVRAAGQANRSLATVLDAPDAHAAEMALLRGEASTDLEDGRLTVRANNREYLVYGAQSIAGMRIDLGPTSSLLEIGLRLHRDEMDRLQWEDEYAMTPAGQMNRVAAGTPGSQDNRIDAAEAVAAFAQAEVEYGRLTLTPGLRFESITMRQENFGRNDPDRTGAELSERANTVSVLIPGLAVRYAFTESLDAFGGVHRGFAPPTSQEGARSEESVNYELGVRYETPLLAGQLVAYFNDYDNLLGSDLAAGGGTGSTEQFNAGEVHVYGLEAAVSADLASAFRLRGIRMPARLAYSFTDATFRSAFESSFGPWGVVEVGDAVPYVARHQAAGTVGVEWARYGVDLRAAYTGDRRDRAGSGAIPEAQRLPGHLVVDLSGNVSVDGRTSVFGSVRNVFNEVYVAAQRPAGLRPGLPRTFLLGLRTSF